MITIDGLELPVVRPESVAEVCALVTQQRAKGEAVYPVGGRTMLDFGLPPLKPGVALDMTALDAVIDYPARDMTITVQAGITFAKLQATLAAENQWLPLDVPDPERMTLGGLIACNVSGPRRYGYGTLRDYVIGISFVSDDGVEVKGGGRVVKNVAGYDLMKLHIGALGTLGVITQVTFKVKPRPEAKTALIVDCRVQEAGKFFDLIASSKSRPVAASGMTYKTIPPNDVNDGSPAYCVSLISFEGDHRTVEWQIQTLEVELIASGYDEFERVGERPSYEEHIQSRAAASINKKYPYISMMTMPASRVAEFVSQYESHEPAGEFLNGVIWIRGAKPIEGVAGYPTLLRQAPTAWKTPERVFGKPTPAWELMAHIKRTLDPDNVFNPGRMFAAVKNS